MRIHDGSVRIPPNDDGVLVPGVGRTGGMKGRSRPKVEMGTRQCGCQAEPLLGQRFQFVPLGYGPVPEPCAIRTCHSSLAGPLGGGGG